MVDKLDECKINNTWNFYLNSADSAVPILTFFLNKRKVIIIFSAKNEKNHKVV